MNGQLQSEDQEELLVHLLKASTTLRLAKKVAREAFEETASLKTAKAEGLPKEAQDKLLQIQESLSGHLRHVQSRRSSQGKLLLRYQGALKSDL
jgi:hypothetical protein